MGIFDSLKFWKKEEAPMMPPIRNSMDFPPPGGAEPPGMDFGGSAGPRFGMPSQLPEAPSFNPPTGPPGSERDFQVINAKIDTLHAQLDLVLQRLEAMQRTAPPEEKQAGRAEPWRWR